MADQLPFWKTKSLTDMSPQEWESLCDGCAKCCLQQLEDEDTQQLVFTNLACDLLDQSACRCTDYSNRSKRVPECMTLTPQNVSTAAEFAPSSCAYRLLVNGQDLPDWHHLNSGSTELMHELGNSVKDKCYPISSVADTEFEEHVVEWPNQVFESCD